MGVYRLISPAILGVESEHRRRPVFPRIACLAMLALFSLCAVPAWSQVASSASVSGLVINAQGVRLPGAQVRLLDPATGRVVTVVSNTAGLFALPTVQPATYTVTVAHKGFSTFRITAQQVDVGTTVRIQAQLKPGDPATFVDHEPIVAQEAGSGATMGAQSLASAPLLGNEAASVSVIRSNTTSSGMVAGAMSDQNRFMLDGAPVTDDMSGDNGQSINFSGLGGTQTSGMPSGILPTSTENVQQVRLGNVGQSADSSNALGGSVDMVTKNGTNQYHGVAYGSYFGSNWGGANTWVGDHTPDTVTGQPYTPLPITHRSRFGVSLGGVLLPAIKGNKTYFFFNYEGSRFPNSTTYYAQVPSMLMRAGVIQVPNSAGVYQAYNLNPTAVSVNGVTYQPAQCGGGTCDPRGIGLSPAIKQLWNLMPAPNESIMSGDQYNVQGYGYPIAAPLNQNSVVGRIDHAFSATEHFFSSYRYTEIYNGLTTQVDIGGGLAGDTFGVSKPTSYKTMHPEDLVFGLTSSLRPNLTNDVRFGYLRNQWQLSGAGSPPQFAGLGGAIEPGGEGTTSVASLSALTNTGGVGSGVSNGLSPYNVNMSGARSRGWLGHDSTIKDDLTWVKDKHVFQFGAMWMHAYKVYSRNDNPQGSLNYPVYQVTNSNINFQGFSYPSTVPSSQDSTWNTYYSYVLGMVSQSQQNYTRNAQLQLNPTGAEADNPAVTETYSLYAGDSWRIKPTVTLSYGLTYLVEMPPQPTNDTPQFTVADTNGNPVEAESYFANRKKAALAGQADQSLLETIPVSMSTRKSKAAFDPFYGGFSPRLGVAWNPRPTSGLLRTLGGDGKATLRASYSRVYGRLNASRTMGSPMQPPGIMQSVACAGPSITGNCAGTNGVTPSTVFRIGPDGLTAPLPAVTQTLQEPYLPGVNGNAAASDFTFMDVKVQPQVSDSISVSLTRQLSSKIGIDVGYTGRKIRHDTSPVNLDSVPYMMTLGGQSFASAFAKTYWSLYTLPTSIPSGTVLTAQPFFESALGGSNSAYCSGYANCTTAVAMKNSTSIRNTAVSDLWAALYGSSSWTVGRSLLSQPVATGQNSQGFSWVDYASLGWANYNALSVSARLRDFHGFTGTANFTWGRALGTNTVSQSITGVVLSDPYNLQDNYGVQSFDIKFMFNFSLTYAPKAFASQKGAIGHLLGGWRFAPIFQSQSGTPTVVGYSEGGCSGCEAFGEVSTTSSGNKAITENAVAMTPYKVSTRASYNNFGSGGVGTNNPTGVNMFSNPAAVQSSFRKCVLGFDTDCAGYAMRGLPYWNMDIGVTKGIKVWKEGRGIDLRFNFTNLFNHPYLAAPSLTVTSPTTFGRITSAANNPRQFQSGIRLYF